MIANMSEIAKALSRPPTCMLISLKFVLHISDHLLNSRCNFEILVFSVSASTVIRLRAAKFGVSAC